MTLGIEQDKTYMCMCMCMCQEQRESVLEGTSNPLLLGADNTYTTHMDVQNPKR